VTEIRSYRRVFDLERRIYTIERLRLNPSGVPVRGLGYFLGVVSVSLLLARVPLLGAPLSGLPWFIADLVAPAALAAGLTLLRVDGRTFHQAAWALVSFWAVPRRTVALSVPSPVRARWRPPDLMLLADGSDAYPRRFRYSGPGAVLVLVAHRSATPKAGRRRRRTARRLLLREPARRLRRGSVIAVEEGATLQIAVDRADVRR
jgi:hypothetical protein